jgi:hypothetical protein
MEKGPDNSALSPTNSNEESEPFYLQHSNMYFPDAVFPMTSQPTFHWLKDVSCQQVLALADPEARSMNPRISIRPEGTRNRFIFISLWVSGVK